MFSHEMLAVKSASDGARLRIDAEGEVGHARNGFANGIANVRQ